MGIPSNTDVEGVEGSCAKKLRFNHKTFNLKEDCMPNGNPANVDTCHPETWVRTVTKHHIRYKLLEYCDKRGDSWELEDQNYLHRCIELVTAENIYHDNCL